MYLSCPAFCNGTMFIKRLSEQNSLKSIRLADNFPVILIILASDKIDGNVLTFLKSMLEKLTTFQGCACHKHSGDFVLSGKMIFFLVG